MQTEKHDSKAKLSTNKSTEISLFCEKLYIYIYSERGDPGASSYDKNSTSIFLRKIEFSERRTALIKSNTKL
jgi:hypothetical protein